MATLDGIAAQDSVAMAPATDVRPQQDSVRMDASTDLLPPQDAPREPSTPLWPPPMMETALEVPPLTPWQTLVRRLTWSAGLRIASALLWAYVVLGEFVVNTGMPEALATSWLLVVLVGTWLGAMFRLHRLVPEPGSGQLRLLGSAGLAIAFFAAAVLVVTIAGSLLALPIDGFITLLLLIVSVGFRVYAARTDPCGQQKLAIGWRVAGVVRTGFAAFLTIPAIISVLDHL
jgi:hypothetical protein